MRISKTALWLSVLVAFLVLIASSAGLFLNSLYCCHYQSKTGECFFTAGRRPVCLAVVKRGYPSAFDREDSANCDGKWLAYKSCSRLGFRTLFTCHDHHRNLVVEKKAFGLYISDSFAGV